MSPDGCLRPQRLGTFGPLRCGEMYALDFLLRETRVLELIRQVVEDSYGPYAEPEQGTPEAELSQSHFFVNVSVHSILVLFHFSVTLFHYHSISVSLYFSVTLFKYHSISVSLHFSFTLFKFYSIPVLL